MQRGPGLNEDLVLGTGIIGPRDIPVRKLPLHVRKDEVTFCMQFYIASCKVFPLMTGMLGEADIDIRHVSMHHRTSPAVNRLSDRGGKNKGVKRVLGQSTGRESTP